VRVSVDSDVCDAHGQCNIIDAELFPLDQDGYCDIGRDKPVPAGKEAAAEQAVDVCPVEALWISE